MTVNCQSQQKKSQYASNGSFLAKIMCLCSAIKSKPDTKAFLHNFPYHFKLGNTKREAKEQNWDIRGKNGWLNYEWVSIKKASVLSHEEISCCHKHFARAPNPNNMSVSFLWRILQVTSWNLTDYLISPLTVVRSKSFKNI